MQTKYSTAILIVFFSLLFHSTPLLSQSKQETNLPPWITGNIPSWKQGELPPFHVGFNRMVVIFSEDKLPEVAAQKAERQLVSSIAKKKGVNISTTEQINTTDSRVTILKDNKVRESGTAETKYTSNIIIDGKSFAKFSLLDKHIQYKSGIYYFAALYLVADEGYELVNMPPVTYSMDKGAWRSLIIPGWAQFYTGQTGKGLAMIIGEAGFIGATIYTHGRMNYHKNRMYEANSIEIKQFYKKQYDNFYLYRNIAGGAALGWYLFNVIDAFTSKKGKLKYNITYHEISLSPAYIQDFHGNVMAINCSIKF